MEDKFNYIFLSRILGSPIQETITCAFNTTEIENLFLCELNQTNSTVYAYAYIVCLIVTIIFTLACVYKTLVLFVYFIENIA